MEKNFDIEICELLEDYNEEVWDIVTEEVENVSKDLVKNLEADSPKNRGKYAKGWKAEKAKDKRKISVTVYNEKGQLTHLLENGHLTRNGKSRTAAQPHIAPNEEKAKESLAQKIRGRLE